MLLRSIPLVSSLALVFLLVACDSNTDPDVSARFIAQLSGDEEVPPVTTDAVGTASFELNRAETELRYTLDVEDLANITQSHIHIGPEGANGQVIVFLFGPGGNATITDRATLATGTIVEADLVAATGFDQTMEHLIELLEQGNAYVNVHTTQHGGGEIRGQVESLP
jgi:hypothetical protein